MSHVAHSNFIMTFAGRSRGSGEGGIRTLGTLLGYGALAKRCFRPLSHLTHCAVEVARISGPFHARQPVASSVHLAPQIPFRCLTIAGLAALAFLFLGGCAPRQRSVATTGASVRPSVVGEIAVVDEEKRFVLIDLDSNLYVPAPGTALRSINPAGKSAHLKASPEQKRPFIAADIVDGEPAVGDEVVR